MINYEEKNDLITFPYIKVINKILNFIYLALLKRIHFFYIVGIIIKKISFEIHAVVVVVRKRLKIKNKVRSLFDLE